MRGPVRKTQAGGSRSGSVAGIFGVDPVTAQAPAPRGEESGAGSECGR